MYRLSKTESESTDIIYLENISETIPHIIINEIPEIIIDELPEEIPQESPQRIHQELPQEIPQEIPENAPKNAPKNAPESSPKNAAENSRANVPEKIPMRGLKVTRHRPRRKKNWFDKQLEIITFSWLWKAFLLGWKREFRPKDLPVLKQDKTGGRMTSLWREEEMFIAVSPTPNRYPSLLRVLKKRFSRRLKITGAVLAVGEIMSKIIQPIIFVYILRCFNDPTTLTLTVALKWSFALLVLNVIRCFIKHGSMYYMEGISMQMRNACCVLVHNKILRLANSVMKSNINPYEMINSFSSDMSRVESYLMYIHYIWLAPLITLAMLCLMYWQMECCGMLAFVAVVIQVIIQDHMFICVSTLISEFYNKRAVRIGFIKTCIDNIDKIKMGGLENTMTILVQKIRTLEIRKIGMCKVAYDIAMACQKFIPRICIFITMAAYIFIGKQTTAENVFVITVCYNTISKLLFRSFAMGRIAVRDISNSIDRIQKFLDLDQVDPQAYFNFNCDRRCPSPELENAFELEHVTATWDTNVGIYALQNVTLKVKSGSLVAITGLADSGKSSFLYLLMEELPIFCGTMKIKSVVSYCSQEPWLFDSTIRDNILFGLPMDEERYDRVVNACHVREDIMLLPHGDKTLVGDRGKNLSAEQRARVNLARSIYTDADIYLLDDPFSVVGKDAGTLIYDDLIHTFLKEKTVVLVTHQYQYMMHADQVIVLDNGRVMGADSLEKLLKSGVKLIDKFQVIKPTDDDKVTKLQFNTPSNDGIASGHLSFREYVTKKRQIMKFGTISKDACFAYFKAARNWYYVATVFILAVIAECLKVGGDYYVAYWVKNQEPLYQTENQTGATVGHIAASPWHIEVYCCILSCTIVFFVIEPVSYFDMCRSISINLHEKMFFSVMRAAMSFVKDNSEGIVNRFSNDVLVVDKVVSQSFRDMTTCIITYVIFIILMSIVSPWLIIPILLVAPLFILIRMFYVKSSVCISRLEGITRRPVFSHLRASLRGLTTVRSLFGYNVWHNAFVCILNEYSAVWLTSTAGQRAVRLYTDISSSLLLSLITFTVMALKGSIEAIDAALVITQCILLGEALKWGIRHSIKLETCMPEVERILEFTNLESERPLDSRPLCKPPRFWPMTGRIEFRYVSLMSGNNEVLKNLNFAIASKEKVGIVVSSRAEKTAIINALFRLADMKGGIYIDGVNTSIIGLHDFRKKISIISKDPFFYWGNLGFNLDPFEEYKDDELWDALEDVTMKSVIEAENGGLSIPVSDRGSNFTDLQRQSLCLASAILRKNSIIVVDEDTDNVVPYSDEFIKKIVKREFEECTVITIAHNRLHTVMDNDRVMVMENGIVVETGRPLTLLHERGRLYDLVRKSGRMAAHKMYKIAKESYVPDTFELWTSF